jgi:hypothetical protein
LKAGLKKAGFACVYVASAGEACRVGDALDLPAAVQRFQRTSPVPIEVEDVRWVPDRGIATTIAQAVLATIARHRAAGGWHDVPAALLRPSARDQTARHKGSDVHGGSPVKIKD